MLNANVWRRMVGVDRATVIEEIVFERRRTRSWSMCARGGRLGAGAGAVEPGRRAMTKGKAGGTGGLWIWVGCGASCRARR